MTGRYTAHQLAEELGVSDSTVSRALSGKGRIGGELSEKIISLAREHGIFTEKAEERRTGNIGIILPMDAWDGAAFFMECIEGVVNSLVVNGYDTLICMAAENDVKPLKRFVESEKADGYIMLRALENDRQIKYLSSLGSPCVLIGSCGMNIAQIDTNHVASGRDLTMYLLTNGMGKIAYLGGKSVYMVNQARLKGFLEAHERLGKEPARNLVFQDILTMAQAQYIVEELLAERVDCIMCGDDLICMRILQALTMDGIRVPTDIAVASLNNGPFLDHYVPQITSVEVNARELGVVAGQQIVKMLKEKEISQNQLLGYNLLFRGSTKEKYGRRILRETESGIG